MSDLANDTWWMHELEQLRQTASMTPEQRLQWLEDALDFAAAVGALEKTRELREKLTQAVVPRSS